VLLAPSERAVIDVLIDEPGEFTLEHSALRRTYPLVSITAVEERAEPSLHCWDLPRAVLADAVRDHPREGFKKFFRQAWADEAARVPGGRARLLRRYGAFNAAIALAPFDQ
jgi:hypothetical protein